MYTWVAFSSKEAILPALSLSTPILAPDDPTFLIFGATGQQGGAAARALRADGKRVRALVRSPEGARAQALANLGVELVEGDLSNPASVRRAMTDVWGVFSVQPNSGQDPSSGLTDADELRFAATIEDLAVELGIGHLVYSSTILVSRGPTGVANLDVKHTIEARLRTLPVRTTILRPGTFMELLLQPALAPRDDVFTFFVEPEERAQLIAVDDIGRIVAGVFDRPEQFGGRSLDIAGDNPTGQSIGLMLSRAFGRPIRYQRFPDDVLAQAPALALTVAAFEPARAEVADVDALNQTFGPLLTFEAWLAGPGRTLLEPSRAAER